MKTNQLLTLSPLILAMALTCGQAAEQRQASRSRARAPQPLAAWSFAQADGDFVPDSTDHGFNARVYGHPQLVTRWGGQHAFEFDGSGNNAFWHGGPQDCGLGIDKRLNRSFTALSLEAWIRKEPAWWMSVVYRDKWDNATGFGLCTEWSSGKAVFGHYDSAGHRSYAQSETVVQDGRWHHVVGTMEPVPGQGYCYRIYVDGGLDAEQIGQWAVEEAPPEGGILKIAYPNCSGADQAYKGALDGVAIYDVALTPAQVKAQFEAGRQRPRKAKTARPNLDSPKHQAGH